MSVIDLCFHSIRTHVRVVSVRDWAVVFVGGVFRMTGQLPWSYNSGYDDYECVRGSDVADNQVLTGKNRHHHLFIDSIELKDTEEHN